MAVVTVYWFKKDKLGEAELTVSLLSFYIVFMASYGWITEQYFLDLLPFVFLLILGYNPKRATLYFLGLIQVLVYAFTVTNQGLFVFNPLLAKFSPSLAASLTNFYGSNNSIIWAVRGYLGLAVSVSLLVFLVALMKPTTFQSPTKTVTKLYRLTLSKFRLKR